MTEITKAELTNKLGAFEHVENLEHQNQFELTYENGTIFQSYGSLIGARINGQLYLTKMHDYSTTTSKHCKLWCGYDTKERRKMLKDGTAILIVA